MEEGLKIIKKIEIAKCPHCEKDIFISTQSMPSNINSVSTKVDIENAKNAVRVRLDEINFYDNENKRQIINWLDNEETLIDFSDVEPLLKQIATEECNKMQNNNK